MSCRDEILSVIRALVANRPDGVFSAREVMQVMRAQRSPYNRSTIETYIVSIMCVNSPANRRKRFDDLERVTRGRYRLR